MQRTASVLFFFVLGFTSQPSFGMAKKLQDFQLAASKKLSALAEDGSQMPSGSKRHIEIMSYNLENFFDATPDTDSVTGAIKEDYEFLPKGHPSKLRGCMKRAEDKKLKCRDLPKQGDQDKCIAKEDRYYVLCLEKDWTAQKVELKMTQLEKALRTGRPSIPNVLAVQEIENDGILRMIANRLGYSKFVMTNSPDARGIDVGLLVNESGDLKLVAAWEHPITGPELAGHATRNILEVELGVGSEQLFVYVVHWPSQFNPSAARILAARTMKQKIADRMAKNPGASFVATGDFNVIPEDFPDPFNTVLKDSQVNGISLIDVHESFMNNPAIPFPVKMQQPKGGYFYSVEMQWNVLDRFFISPNLQDRRGLDVYIWSYQIYAPEHLKGTYKYDTYKDEPHFGSVITGVPKRYNHFGPDAMTDPGFSDHYPIRMEINY